jgi:succinate dehydrogenase / fumarate reductase cytochrome b subunit
LWVLFLATGPEYYNFYQKFLKSLVGKFILVGFTWSFVYHMLNGIRHLAWDFGYGYEIKTANLSGVVVLLLSILTTFFIWII